MKRLIFLAIVAQLISITALAQSSVERGAGNRSQKSSRSGSITGRAITDTGQPIANAAVTVSRMSSRPESLNALTNEEGNFKVEGVAAGLYNVFVRAPGYVYAGDRATTLYARPGDHVTIRMVKGAVITGTVTDAEGQLVVGIAVSAIRIRSLDGNKLRYASPSSSRQTDDRGVYRLYGLTPGVYIISCGRQNFSIPTSPFTYEMPTYYPSSTIDTAAEVTVRSGDEASNIDIRYRSEQGHAVSGQIVGATQAPKGNAFYRNTFSVSLAYASNGIVLAQSSANEMAGHSFSIEGVADGEYVLVARRYNSQEDPGATSKRIRVTVKGADVTGLKVPAEPLGSIEGRVVIEKAAAEKKDKCESKESSGPEEIMVQARSEQTGVAIGPFSFLAGGSQAIPNESGEFKLLRVESGRYNIAPLLKNDDWYVRSITLAQSPQAKTGVDVARNGIAIKAGERLAGLTIAIAEGAASISGRVTRPEGAAIGERLRMHLVPVDLSLRDDALRYAEADAQSDGTFEIKNLAPGRYWIIARPAPGEDEQARRPAAQDAIARANLRREAEAANIIVELQSCQRAIDYQLRHPAAKAAAKEDK